MDYKNIDIRIEESKQVNKFGQKVKHLVIDDNIWMSNDDAEYEDIERSVAGAHGHCWVGGLGLGLIVEELCKSDKVTSVTVTEIVPEIIELFVEKHNMNHNIYSIMDQEDRPHDVSNGEINSKKVNIIEGDAKKCFFWPRFGNAATLKYDWMYMDIWTERTEDVHKNVVIPFKENAKLHLREYRDENIDYWDKPKIDNGDFLPFEDALYF